MAIINTGLLTRGIRNEFFATFNGVKPFFERICTRIQSDGDSETYRFLGQIPPMREWGTGRISKGVNTESYSVDNLKYELTLDVDRDEVADSKLPQIMIRVKEMARRAATHKDYLVAQLLMNGSTTGFNSYDGVSFINDAHVSGLSGNQDNKLTSTGCTDPDNPTTAEGKKAFRVALAALMAFKDDVGEPQNIEATGLALVCHPTVYINWLESLTSALISNSTNVLPQFQVDIMPMPWLTDVSKWWLLKNDGVVRPFIFQDREAITLAALAAGSEEDFKREVFLYGARGRYRLTYGYWQNCVETNMTT